MSDTSTSSPSLLAQIGWGAVAVVGTMVVIGGIVAIVMKAVTG